MVRMAMVKDRQALRGHLEELAATPKLKRVIVMHGDSVDEGADRFLRDVAATL
jgi:hypothetical protein